MAIHSLQLTNVHPSWQACIHSALKKMDADYLHYLNTHNHWLPGPEHIFNAFSLPLNNTRYVLLGESPYPRNASANGYAFWDAAVKTLWSTTGLSKPVNRATSLRNIIKMLLIADHSLTADDASQAAIARVNKENLVQTNDEFFMNFIRHGFLLLNATLVLQQKQPPIKDARQFAPFLQSVLAYLIDAQPSITFILFGGIAKAIEPLLPVTSPQLIAEHPYNVSFITNPKVLAFFRPLHLLRK